VKVLSHRSGVNRSGSFGRIDRAQRLAWPRPYRNVFGQIDPANSPTGIHVKLSRPRDVVSFRSRAAMKNIVALDHRSVCIGQKRKRVAPSATMGLCHLNRIDADRREMYASFLEIGQLFLKTPQLGVTERSPMPAIKNQDRAVGRQQIGQCDSLPALIGQ